MEAYMFKFLKDLFFSTPATERHPLDSVTQPAPYKAETPAPLEITAEPAVVVIEQAPTPIVLEAPIPQRKESKAKTPAVKKPVASKPVDKKPRGRKPKAQKKSK